MSNVLCLRLHHIGIVTQDILSARQFYETALGYRACTAIIHDPVATAFVQFLIAPGSQSYLELVAPDSPSSKLALAASRPFPLHHLCFAAESMEEALQHFRMSGAVIIQHPTLACAFAPRRIAWLVSPDALLVEVVEEGASGEL